MKKITIFAQIRIFDVDGGITWIAAATAQEAVPCFAENLGYDTSNQGGVLGMESFHTDHPEIWNDIKELTPKQMKEFTFTREEMDDPKRPNAAKISFEQRLNELIEDGQEFPVFFATSEY